MERSPIIVPTPNEVHHYEVHFADGRIEECHNLPTAKLIAKRGKKENKVTHDR